MLGLVTAITTIIGPKPYLRRLCRWLFMEAPSAWGMTLFVAVSLMLAVIIHTEASYRYCGLWLQAIGISAVIYDVHRTRMHFGRSGLLAPFRTWIKTIPRYRGRVYQVGAPTGVITSASAAGAGTAGKPSPSPDRSLEDRVAELETAVANLTQKFATFRQDTAQKHSNLIEAFEHDRSKRSQEAAAARNFFELIQLGNGHNAVVGAIFLMTGLVTSTLSTELGSSPRWVGMGLLLLSCSICFVFGHKDRPNAAPP